jgi:hypothetical protein
LTPSSGVAAPGLCVYPKIFIVILSEAKDLPESM